jgi:hypothetical protein
MKRPKGMLLRKIPYNISKNGKYGLKISINELSGLEAGQKVYQERMDNGIVLLIPESIYNEE